MAFLASNDFEDAVRKRFPSAADSDTLACIAGGVCPGTLRGVPEPGQERGVPPSR